ncbi:MAG TPA: DMT family protein [Pirellulales bacterium]|nr:DMT family protein [Pirellulales bacterium]
MAICSASGYRAMWTILLLLCSNAFMTLAWYGHLKFKTYPLMAVILASWLIALPEYVFQVPANRIGHGHFSAPQLKIIQEVISIAAFVLFNAVYLKDRIRGTDWLAFGLILAAVVVMMAPRVTSLAAK